MFFEQMHPTWQSWLVAEKSLLESIESKVLRSEILPPEHLVMRAFSTDPTQIKAVLLGQDPYPTPGDAVGLAFAMKPQGKMPRSLKNIAQELKSDLGPNFVETETSLDLARWSNQGVLLLNRALTTQPEVTGAHLGKDFGWQQFTFKAVEGILEHQPIVLMLWGNFAKAIVSELQKSKFHNQIRIVESAHPSPLSASKGFFGSRPFSRTNSALKDLGYEPIDWSC
ncbi:MAG: uracil-DNA glycosylase [Actinomycetes bacterium]